MFKLLTQYALFSFALLPCQASAEPIKLKLAYYTSDQAQSYNIAVRPFVDAVNKGARGGIIIETYPSGSLGKDQAQQPQLVRNGTADIAYVNLGPTGNQFPDHSVMQLPGLFNDLREATVVHTRVIVSGIMRGYEDFFVIGAFATEPESIHTRPPIATLDDLRGKRIRANNSLQAEALAKLGMSPVVLPIAQTVAAITSGTIDGAATATVPLISFGLGRVVTHHFFLRLGPSVTTILMNRKKYESLPKAGQDVIREYSGEWLAARFIEGYRPYNKKLLDQLKSDPRRTVIFPSQADLDTAQVAFKRVTEEWLGKDSRNPELFKLVTTELARLRATR